MNPFVIEHADRRAMLYCIDSLRAASYRIAPVLHAVSALRDCSVDGAFRVRTEEFLTWKRSGLSKPLQFLTISLPRQDGTTAHLHALKDRTAMLSIEHPDGTSDVCPYPFRIADEVRMKRQTGAQNHYLPGAALWVKDETSLFMGLHRYARKQKSDAIDRLDFSEGPQTRTKDPKNQPFVDALFEDLLLAADEMEKLDVPLDETKPSGFRFDDGRINGWPQCLPARLISPKRMELFQHRAELALKWFISNQEAKYASIYATQFQLELKPRNNMLSINGSDAGGRLAYFLAKEEITEQDLIGYEDWEIQSFRFQAKPFNQDKPSFHRELAVHSRITSKPSAHELMEISLLFQDAYRRRDIRRKGMESERAQRIS